MNRKQHLLAGIVLFSLLFPLSASAKTSQLPDTAPATESSVSAVETTAEGTASTDNDSSAVETESRASVLKKTPWNTLAAQTPIPYDKDTPEASLTPEVLASWWNVFHDEDMTHLIELSMENSRNLEIARSRVEQARASLGISKGAMLPWLDLGGSYGRVELPENIWDPALSMSPIPGLLSAPDKTYDISSLHIDASWEPDFFGRQRANKEAASHALEAQRGALYSTWVTLSAETGMNYINLRTLQAQLAIVERHADLQKEKVDLLQADYDAGLINQYPLMAMTYTEKQTRAQIPQIKQAIAETMTRLSVLTGTLPGELDYLLTPADLPDVDPIMYHAIPAETLRQRPDIYAAEQMLSAQIAKTEEAKANLKPRFNLLGLLGLVSIGGGSLFDSGTSAFGVGASMLAPLFHGGALRQNVKLQSETAREYEAAYENTVLKAAGEVRDAMTSIVQDKDRTSQMTAGKDAAESARDVAENRFHYGLADYQPVIDAERSLLSFESGEIVSRGQEMIDLIRLFKSLGGGWQMLDDAEQAAAEASK
jgi:NodT family efflux transporter outer membrane factor (OMF) lipoprotein